jgi:hypothetical protein
MMSREPESGMQKVAAGDMRAALCSAHVAAGRTLVRRTQCRVKARCDQMEERRKQVRQRIGLAALCRRGSPGDVLDGLAAANYTHHACDRLFACSHTKTGA